MNKPKQTIENLIIGSGITGLSCAYHLLNKNSAENFCLIVEKENELGGLARSKIIDGFIFDYSAHLIHTKSRYFSEWLDDNLKEELNLHKRNAWVYSHGVFTKYPFQANLYGLPKNVVKECLLGLLGINGVKNKPAANFEEWCYSKFGPGISKHFMIPYNEKFWNTPARRITLDWIDGFVPQPQVRDIVNGTFEYSDKEYGYNSRFFYPKKHGVDILVKTIAKDLNNIILNKKVIEIDLKEKWVLTLDGEKISYRNLISTVPLIELKSMVLDMDKKISKLFSKLRYISVVNINMGINRNMISDKDWVYFPEDNFLFYRVGFPMNFAPSSTLKGCSSLYIDVSYSKDFPIQSDKGAVIDRVKADLVKVGIIAKDENIAAIDYNDIKYAYILYDRNWVKVRQDILNYLSANSVYSVGRFGGWNYLSMEGCFLEGRKTAEQLIKNEARVS
ncbi:MAG: FAD-dependent oxidoreductase [Candidatus Omnitrophica bacterium]|nr:FAD-dependent oxidoreductase [Candidatus Omnitrophota bacterium]